MSSSGATPANATMSSSPPPPRAAQPVQARRPGRRSRARSARVEPGADLEQCGDAPARAGDAHGRLGDAREDAQERRLPRPVGADHRDRLALRDLQRDVVQRQHLARRGARAAPAQRLPERRRLTLPEQVALRQVLGLDRVHGPVQHRTGAGRPQGRWHATRNRAGMRRGR